MNIDQLQEYLLIQLQTMVKEVKKRVKGDILNQDHVQKYFQYFANQQDLNFQKLKLNLVFTQENLIEETYQKEKIKNQNEINTMIQKLPKQVQQVLEKRSSFLFENVELENFENPSLVFKKFHNCSGFFQMKDDKRNGRGIEFFDSGNYFEGYFKNDKACGKGYYISASGLIHQGCNKDNLFQGYGEWPLDESYNGDHDENCASGFGKKQYKNGECYVGFWKDNKRSGYGEIYKKDTIIQKGLFQNDKLIKQI